MKKALLLVVFLCFYSIVWGHGADLLRLADPESLPKPPANAPGYPSSDANFDVSAHFVAPTPGFGEVPFWWWTGDPLDKERLAWQIRELHEKGVAGMQVNYAHRDTEGWPTFPNSPEIFTPEWWDFWAFAAAECKKYDMGLGLSTYTLDWTKSKNLFNEVVYNDPEFHTEILKARQLPPNYGVPTPNENSLGFWAYPVLEGGKLGLGIPLAETEKHPDVKKWEVWEFYTIFEAGTLNPIHPQSGTHVIEKFFQPFEDHNPGKNASGLNWFFNDELRLGVGGSNRLWCRDFAEKFREFKGYDVFAYLPGVCAGGKLGDFEPKFRMDYADVQMQLTEQRYFKPIYLWHQSRGLIYGCDNNGRGMNPTEYGDYFRAVRWYSAPGHDTPGGHADFIKGKVSSSIANLYHRPRVWLEGYHSLGWGASPEQLMFATNENYVYGCTLLNLHGLYYTTHGSMWEWAPPCYHFRMPYWKHMGTFLKYFERLSYVMSQGTWRSQIAILYPTSPGMANFGENQNFATKTAFDAAKNIYATGRDITFIDDQSIQRAKIENGQLCVSGMKFRVAILPGVEAVRWETLLKLRDFARAGGTVICLEKVPTVSDHAGANDPELRAIVEELFGANGRGIRTSANDTAYFRTLPWEVQVREEKNVGTPKYIHRTIGKRDVFLVMGVEQGARVAFQTQGAPERWNPMTGERTPLDVCGVSGETVEIRMPLTAREATLLVFDRMKTPQVSEDANSVKETTCSVLPLDGEWNAQLVPTLDNQWGDFRLPVTPDNRQIGAEARRMRYHRLNPEEVATSDNFTAPDFNDSAWEKITYGFGEKLRLLKTDGVLNNFCTIEDRMRTDSQPYAFSWRAGIEGNPGHQGWHGLKEYVTDHFIGLGATKSGHNETLFVPENPAKVYYLMAQVQYSGDVTIQRGGNLPARVWLDGQEIPADAKTWKLNGKNQTLILEYTTAGRGFWLFEKGTKPERVAQTEASELPPGSKPGTPLAMTWFDCDFVPFQKINQADETSCVIYRFRAPAGLQGLVLTLDERASELPEVFVDGKPVPLRATQSYQKRTRRAVCELSETQMKPCVVAIRAKNLDPTLDRGALFPEPIRLETGTGTVAHFGSWEDNGDVLDCYSGGILYSKMMEISPEFLAAERVEVRFNSLPGTAEVRVNGQSAGVLVASPWTLDLTGLLHEGENLVEIEVYNTLRNHYRTVPTRY